MKNYKVRLGFFIILIASFLHGMGGRRTDALGWSHTAVPADDQMHDDLELAAQRFVELSSALKYRGATQAVSVPNNVVKTDAFVSKNVYSNEPYCYWFETNCNNGDFAFKYKLKDVSNAEEEVCCTTNICVLALTCFGCCCCKK